MRECGQDGYESRHVVHALFKATVRRVAEGGKSAQEMAKELIFDAAVNVMPIAEVGVVLYGYVGIFCVRCCAGGLVHCFRLTRPNVHPHYLWWGDADQHGVRPQVPSVVHSFLSRGVHSGSLIMTAVYMKELEVPIFGIDELREFFCASKVCI